MPNYTYILEKLNCARKHIQIIPNGIDTKVFALLADSDCPQCIYKGFCNEITSIVQRKAQLMKEVEVIKDGGNR